MKDVGQVTIAGTADVHNASLPTDVDGSGWTTPLDALPVNNSLNAYGAQTIAELAKQTDLPVHFYDVDDGDRLTTTDALVVIVRQMPKLFFPQLLALICRSPYCQNP